MNKTKVVLVLTSLVTAYAFGRWASPVKVITETKTIEVEKKSSDSKSDTDRNKHKETIVTEVVHPDGTKETTTRTIEDSTTNKKTDTETRDELSQSQSSSKETVYSSSKVTVSALAGVSLTDFSRPPVYGGSVSKPVLGPITVGFFGLTSGVVGTSLGLSF